MIVVATDPKSEAEAGDASREARLIAGVRARDLGAFEQLYRGEHRRLTRFLLNLTRSPLLVEEVLNDTMLAVWEKPDGFRGASRLSTWIFAIAYRKAMRAMRRVDPIRPASPAEEQAGDDAPDRAIGQARVRRRLAEAMAALSPDHRTVIDLTYYHELSCREIAEVMACPVDTVKTRMFHARRHLRRLLDGDAADWL